MADGITRIAVEGFKSIAKRQEIEIAPLTILAGANSSGKSSLMQPLLLLKQTLEATYDPGPLLLNGPNAKFTSADQIFSRLGKGKHFDYFAIGYKHADFPITTLFFRKNLKKGLDLERMTLANELGETLSLKEGMP